MTRSYRPAAHRHAGTAAAGRPGATPAPRPRWASCSPPTPWPGPPRSPGCCSDRGSRPTPAAGAPGRGPSTCSARPATASPAAPTRSSTTSSPSACSACRGSPAERTAATTAMTNEAYEADLCRRVSAALRRDRPGVEVGLFARMPGGHSGLTYRVETTAGGLVVKSVPPGQKADRAARHAAPGPGHRGAGAAPAVPVPAHRRHRRARAGLVRHGAGRGRVARAGPRRPRGAAGAGRCPDAACRRDCCRPCTTSRSTRCRSTREPLSPLDELDRWARTMAAVPPELVPDADRLRQRLADVGARRRSSPRSSTATTGSAT